MTPRSPRTGPPPAVVVTGAASGIGYHTARALVDRGYRVFGSVRRPEDAARLGAEFGTGFTPLEFDVTDAPAVQAAAVAVEAALGGVPLHTLVNNAGTTVLGPLLHLSSAELRRQLEINVVGLFEVTRRFLPLLGARADFLGPPGRVVNIGSTSGRLATPFFGFYAASKHALEGLSDTLRRELLLYGIDVVVIEPTIVDTPLVEKSLAQAEAFRNTEYGPAIAATLASVGPGAARVSLPVERVVRAILRAVESPHPRARYVIHRSRVLGWWLPRLLPTRLLDRAIGAALRLRPGKAQGPSAPGRP